MAEIQDLIKNKNDYDKLMNQIVIKKQSDKPRKFKDLNSLKKHLDNCIKSNARF